MNIATAILISLWVLSLLAFATGRGIKASFLGASWEISPRVDGTNARKAVAIGNIVIYHGK